MGGNGMCSLCEVEDKNGFAIEDKVFHVRGQKSSKMSIERGKEV